MNIRCNEDGGPPPARRDFARRLRELRVPRGFRTARSLARSLDIDENRYTRYERAEVEPDLDMIRRICETLGVTPNELLGESASPLPDHSGASQDPALDGSRKPPDQQDGSPATPHQTTAWLLAEAATAVRAAGSRDGASAESGASLRVVAQTGALYRRLMERPFETITELSEEPAIKSASTSSLAVLQQRIDSLLRLLKHG